MKSNVNYYTRGADSCLIKVKFKLVGILVKNNQGYNCSVIEAFFVKIEKNRKNQVHEFGLGSNVKLHGANGFLITIGFYDLGAYSLLVNNKH